MAARGFTSYTLDILVQSSVSIAHRTSSDDYQLDLADGVGMSQRQGGDATTAGKQRVCFWDTAPTTLMQKRTLFALTVGSLCGCVSCMLPCLAACLPACRSSDSCARASLLVSVSAFRVPAARLSVCACVCASTRSP